jgi:3-methyl-2-oxobutanoate hydroxymethyltransferase|tara:strand:+ start:154 stop:918 length:765 start_codon:yes stop_codon:yes gene_type:complete
MEVSRLKSMKGLQAITMLTAYDFNTAKLLEEIQIDVILVGDSVGNVVYGFESTKDVTMELMIQHTEAVRRGALTSFIVADMPFGSDEPEAFALENARKLMGSGADAVKVEGKPEVVKFLVENKIHVMGHAGLLPQTAEEMKVQGKDAASANSILTEAKALDKAGCFAVVLEMVPAGLADTITKSLAIPTIGIGAGKFCDGQVLVINDILGLVEDFHPKFVKRYAELNSEATKAIKDYVRDVKAGEFPDDEHSFD